ncbi:unnamed protein product, partial [Ectocarpus sp. 4 AP-2014]
MVADISDSAAEAARLALEISSTIADAVSCAVDLGEELPVVKPVFKTLKAIHTTVETVKNNREELAALEQRCTYITACFVVKCRLNESDVDVAPLEDCVEAAKSFAERCSRRGKVSRVLKASSDKSEIARINSSVDHLTTDLGLAGIAVLEGKVDEMKKTLDRIDQRLESLPRSLGKLAAVPMGAPVRKSWHVERRRVMATVLDALNGSDRACVVALAGYSGSGKTTVAAEIVRSAEVREAFSDGIVWLPVNEGAKERLPSLMLQLALMVHEEIGGSVGRVPSACACKDSATYIKQRLEEGHTGRGLKCLVVADNVWEEDVVSKLEETGMWVLLSTRDEAVVKLARGKAVVVDELSQADAESVLKRAAELPPEARLPDDAVDLIKLCGRVAMDVAFVGRWSTVRGRHDRASWSDAASTIRTEMEKVGHDPDNDSAENATAKRRKAILQGGFEDLAIGSDDERVQRLYLSLAVMPDGHAFSLKDAAVLLYDRSPSTEDEASAGGVVDVLERWSIIRSAQGTYRMHDAHTDFARECLLDRGHVRRPALNRWTRYLSSLDVLRSTDCDVLQGLWLAIERLGGDGWGKTRPYAKALGMMLESDALLRTTAEAVGWFQEAQEDFEGASASWHRLLEVEKRELGADHPFVLNTYGELALWAERLGNIEEAAEWHEKEVEGLPLALARMNALVDSGLEADLDDADGLSSVAATALEFRPGDRALAETLLRRSLDIKEAILGSEHLQVADTLRQLGVSAREAGRLDEAEGLLRRCLAIGRQKLGQEDMEVACTLYELGACVRKAGRWSEAERMLRCCLTIEETKLGPEDDVQVATTLQQLGVCARESGRVEQAEEFLRRCLTIKENKLGPEDVGVAFALHELGVCVREAGRLGEAEVLLRRCLAIWETKLGPEDVQVATTLQQLGVCARESGRVEQAEEFLRRCLTIKENKLGPEDAGVAFALHEHGVCVREAGRLGEAEVLLRRCLAIWETKLGRDDVKVAHTLYELGVCLRQGGRLEEAEIL